MTLEGGGDLLQEFDAAVAVAPLVIVPRDELEKPVVELDRRTGVKNRRSLAMDKVAGGDFLVGIFEDALKIGLGGLFQRGADFLEGGFLGGAEGEVDDRDGRGRDAEGHAGEL